MSETKFQRQQELIQSNVDRAWAIFYKEVASWCIDRMDYISRSNASHARQVIKANLAAHDSMPPEVQRDPVGPEAWREWIYSNAAKKMHRDTFLEHTEQFHRWTSSVVQAFKDDAILMQMTQPGSREYDIFFGVNQRDVIGLPLTDAQGLSLIHI